MCAGKFFLLVSAEIGSPSRNCGLKVFSKSSFFLTSRIRRSRSLPTLLHVLSLVSIEQYGSIKGGSSNKASFSRSWTSSSTVDSIKP
ncbi:hypothetical protein GDO81_026848 [Engystomops pustulosus]|uniref:Uncharacterized protein n=1 Tax=Engystomops pustulosus TaxID=76066 RepID=A0AAV6YF98_ENGPU|nr:hypothetical protein GDO81_026848 [Engystomops pustulosus]